MDTGIVTQGTDPAGHQCNVLEQPVKAFNVHKSRVNGFTEDEEEKKALQVDNSSGINSRSAYERIRKI